MDSPVETLKMAQSRCRFLFLFVVTEEDDNVHLTMATKPSPEKETKVVSSVNDAVVAKSPVSPRDGDHHA